MQQLLFLLRQSGLVLLMGLTGGFWSGISQAGSNLDINLTASIVNSTCKLSLENGGKSTFPTSRGHGFTITTAAVNMRLPTRRAARLLTCVSKTVQITVASSS